MATDLFQEQDSVTREDIHDLLMGVRDEIRSQVQAVETRVLQKMEDLISQMVQEAVGKVDLKPLIREEVGEYDFGSLLAGIVEEDVKQAVGDVECMVVQAMTTAYETAVDQLSQIIMAMPQPVINVPEGAPPQVTVVNEAPVIHVPETQPPVVNIPETHFPEMVAPVVNVTMPHRKTTKNIAYDEYGRPSTITEQEGD